MVKNCHDNDNWFTDRDAKHRKISPLSSEQSSLESSSQKVVIVHLDYTFRSKILTNFYRIITKCKIDSLILKDSNSITLSYDLIYHTKHIQSICPPPQLLYRGSRDGFKAKDFHSRCDNQGPTLTLIKSSEPYNQIFGGFTTQSWNSPSSGGQYISDDLAFLFKIVNNENNNRSNKSNQSFINIFNICKQDYKKKRAIYIHSNYLPTFGAGCDICISTECNVRNNSFSNFGYTYELPSSPSSPSSLTNNSYNSDGDDELVVYKYENEKARNYLAGSYQFKVSEIEVFKIITDTITSININD